MNNPRYRIEKDGYLFVFNYNTTHNRNFPYMIHIYKVGKKNQRTCLYYRPISKEDASRWTHYYMSSWFNKWLKED